MYKFKKGNRVPGNLPNSDMMQWALKPMHTYFHLIGQPPPKMVTNPKPIYQKPFSHASSLAPNLFQVLSIMHAKRNFWPFSERNIATIFTKIIHDLAARSTIEQWPSESSPQPPPAPAVPCPGIFTVILRVRKTSPQICMNVNDFTYFPHWRIFAVLLASIFTAKILQCGKSLTFMQIPIRGDIFRTRYHTIMILLWYYYDTIILFDM